MAHREKSFLSKTCPHSVAADDLPRSGTNPDVEIADPNGNRAQRRAAKRVGLTVIATEENQT